MYFQLLSLWMKSYGVTIQMKDLQQYIFTWYYLIVSILQNEISNFRLFLTQPGRRVEGLKRLFVAVQFILCGFSRYPSTMFNVSEDYFLMTKSQLYDRQICLSRRLDDLKLQIIEINFEIMNCEYHLLDSQYCLSIVFLSQINL